MVGLASSADVMLCLKELACSSGIGEPLWLGVRSGHIVRMGPILPLEICHVSPRRNLGTEVLVGSHF